MNLFWLYLFETIGQEIMAIDYFIFVYLCLYLSGTVGQEEEEI